jgi:uncharacterized membrane protein YeaQ/YmgE (transglycosylase-associated protein family)
MHLLWFLLIGLVAGWLAGKLTKGSGFGAMGNIVLGVLGSFVGGFVFRQIGITAGGTLGSLIVATVGAAILIYVVRLFKKA